METREIEVWKPIPDYEGLYEVSSWGNVKSLKRKVFGRWGFLSVKEKILLKSLHNLGYLQVTLFNKGIRKKLYIHILVAKAFFENYYNKCEVNHKDRVKDNNYYKNLEVTNRRENVSHYSIETNVAGFTGVCKKKHGFVSEIRINNKRIYLGYFSDPKTAHEAYLNALKEYGLENKYATQSQ